MIESSQERAIGRLEGKLDALAESNRAASESRGRMHDELRSMRSDVQDMKGEMKGLSDRVSAIEPEWKDYREKKQQVEGAGKLGRGLWWLGGIILAAASWAGATWYQMTGRPPP